jgi:hypothetical protein
MSSQRSLLSKKFIWQKVESAWLAQHIPRLRNDFAERPFENGDQQNIARIAILISTPFRDRF